jgi:hypothetical protein
VAKTRVMVDFPTREDAVEWFRQAERVGLLGPNAALYVPDGLDRRAVGVNDQLIVRGKDDGRLDETKVA